MAGLSCEVIELIGGLRCLSVQTIICAEVKKSVRALELRLKITSHSQIEWLNLPKTMPNLKTIYITYFRCFSCKVEHDGIRVDSSLLSSPPALGCFRSSLINLHPGVPLKRFLLLSNFEFKSAEELLLQSQ